MTWGNREKIWTDGQPRPRWLVYLSKSLKYNVLFVVSGNFRALLDHLFLRVEIFFCLFIISHFPSFVIFRIRTCILLYIHLHIHLHTSHILHWSHGWFYIHLHTYIHHILHTLMFPVTLFPRAFHGRRVEDWTPLHLAAAHSSSTRGLETMSTLLELRFSGVDQRWGCGSVSKPCTPGEHQNPWQNLHGYGSIPINTIFNGMNIHLPAIFGFTRGTRFWPIAMWWPGDPQKNGGSWPTKAMGIAKKKGIDMDRFEDWFEEYQGRLPKPMGNWTWGVLSIILEVLTNNNG